MKYIDNCSMNTYFVGMKTVVSERGQITIPKKIRTSLSIQPGTVLDITLVDGKIVGSKKEPADDHRSRHVRSPGHFN